MDMSSVFSQVNSTDKDGMGRESRGRGGVREGESDHLTWLVVIVFNIVLFLRLLLVLASFLVSFPQQLLEGGDETTEGGVRWR
jgi:hypothetical protein